MDALGTLQALARGRLMDDLCEAMLVVAEEVINTGRKGKVSLNLTISQATPGEPFCRCLGGDQAHGAEA